MHGRHPIPTMPAALQARRRGMTLLLTAGLLLWNSQARAYGDVDDGHRLATSWCSGCHQVELRTQTSASDAIPSFQAVAAMPSTTSMSIRAFLSTTHAVMPDLKLTNGQIDDVGAYILSLRGRQGL
jgi:mono/diheme cytochrome c family protein